jgi:hypothetical protein
MLSGGIELRGVCIRYQASEPEELQGIKLIINGDSFV